ncbi:hypothetical protein [Paenirhodobacter sp.]|uniref:hypothetical protein n=1 Tax=Paenirhodobacter sp. TaxID=1965326 RepID=UPI003B3E55CF
MAITHHIVNNEENILAKDLCSKCYRQIQDKGLRTVFWRGTIKRLKAQLAEGGEA